VTIVACKRFFGLSYEDHGTCRVDPHMFGFDGISIGKKTGTARENQYQILNLERK